MRQRFIHSATVVRVIDGDTIDLNLDLGFHIHLGIRTRLIGINAPEMSTPAGLPAKLFLQSMVPVGAIVTVETFRDPTDKYGRWLATVTPDNAKLSCNAAMLASDHAVEMK